MFRYQLVKKKRLTQPGTVIASLLMGLN